MKVVATVLRQCPDDQVTVRDVKLLFLNDLLKLFQVSRDNRRVLLQQSVWQDWLLGIGKFLFTSFLQPKVFCLTLNF